MALVYTSYADVASRWVEGTVPATQAQVETLLEDAEDTVLGEFADLDTRIDAGLPILRVRKVIARMVIRHLRNPGGVRTTQQGAGPYTETLTYGGDEPGALYLTDEDRAELGGHRVGGAFTINTIPATFTTLPPPDPWEVLP